MMNNVDRLELLLSTKTWEELLPDEKALAILELGSEEQYVLMRKINQTLVSNESDLSPDPKILNHITEVFTDLHKPVWRRALAWRVPAYALVIPVSLLLVSVFWLTTKVEIPAPTANVIKTVRDTVYVKQSPDTVFIQKTLVRYIERKTTLVPAFTIAEPGETEKVNNGINMKENEELEKLLVSGS